MTSADSTNTMLRVKEFQELEELREFKKTLIMNLKEGKICIDKIDKDSFNLVVENKIYALEQLKEKCKDPKIERQIDHLESYLIMLDHKYYGSA